MGEFSDWAVMAFNFWLTVILFFTMVAGTTIYLVLRIFHWHPLTVIAGWLHL